MKKSFSQYWTQPIQGNYTLEIDNLSSVDGYYELPTTTVSRNITLDFTFTGSDLLKNNSNDTIEYFYRLEIQLWSTDSDRERIKHFDGFLFNLFQPVTSADRITGITAFLAISQ